MRVYVKYSKEAGRAGIGRDHGCRCGCSWLAGLPPIALRWPGEAVWAGLPPFPLHPLAPHCLSSPSLSACRFKMRLSLADLSTERDKSLMRGLWEV